MKKTVSMRLVFIALFVLLVSHSAWAQDQAKESKPTAPTQLITTVPDEVKTQLPKALDGFEWHLYKKSIVQIPIGWNEKENSDMSNGFPISVYGASPERFSKSKMFEMGITIKVISETNKIKSIPAKKIAKILLKPFIKSHQTEDILLFSQKTNGDFENTLFRFRDAPKGLTPIIVHKYIMANDVTDSVYIFTFESPETEWKENWKKFGTPFLGNIIFISE